ncbi:MAG: hypothetical protein U1A07_13650 [Phenylobacterium sp.]|nr:hypothetical protein [Phenylobacterium sp.]
MSRYRVRKAGCVWSIVDHRTGEDLSREERLGPASAQALAELLNSLEKQQDWRAEARLWPVPA